MERAEKGRREMGVSPLHSENFLSSMLGFANWDSALLVHSNSNQLSRSCRCSAPVSPDSTDNQVDRRQRQFCSLGFVSGGIVLCHKTDKTWLLSLLIHVC